MCIIERENKDNCYHKYDVRFSKAQALDHALIYVFMEHVLCETCVWHCAEWEQASKGAGLISMPHLISESDGRKPVRVLEITRSLAGSLE